MSDPVVFGAARKVHHARTRCQAKNRYLVTDDWGKVTCSFCLKKLVPRPEKPLPEGVESAGQGCLCGDCFRCRSRKKH